MQSFFHTSPYLHGYCFIVIFQVYAIIVSPIAASNPSAFVLMKRKGISTRQYTYDEFVLHDIMLVLL